MRTASSSPYISSFIKRRLSFGFSFKNLFTDSALNWFFLMEAAQDYMAEVLLNWSFSRDRSWTASCRCFTIKLSNTSHSMRLSSRSNSNWRWELFKLKRSLKSPPSRQISCRLQKWWHPSPRSTRMHRRKWGAKFLATRRLQLQVP